MGKAVKVRKKDKNKTPKPHIGAGSEFAGGATASHIGGPTLRPSSLSMLVTKKSGRPWTLSVAFPASIIANAQTKELKAYLVGQLARALTIFGVDEVILWDDQSGLKKSEEDPSVSEAMAFFARNLQYLETPQYLRKDLFTFHRDLKFCGLQNPLDAPHHLRRSERLRYREGVAVEDKSVQGGTYVNCGLDDYAWIDGIDIPLNTRVTVKIAKDGTARAVSPQEPREKAGLYWGYQTRVCSSMKDIFRGPWGAYDLVIGTSERGKDISSVTLTKYTHALIVFGGLAGLEEAVKDEGADLPPSVKPEDLFHHYINICPTQTSRTIRTEEAALITFAQLRPMLVAIHQT
eukprot:GEMP01078006.1.p1 GENE.GEMP01078006.1~~GEMP01078006.1.p1  ORF type:complete len:347 (-),score=59.01 GEMP01078006.1:27-1067(-)